jgi:hypothetical protein
MKLTPEEAANVAYHKSRPAEFQSAHIRSELLNYLAKLPQTVDHKGPEAIGELAVQIGNALLWLQGTLEPHGHLAETPLHETPQTIYALGKQFRQVGMKLWNAKHAQRDVSIRQMSIDLEAMRDRLTLFEAAYVERGAL